MLPPADGNVRVLACTAGRAEVAGACGFGEPLFEPPPAATVASTSVSGTDVSTGSVMGVVSTTVESLVSGSVDSVVEDSLGMVVVLMLTSALESVDLPGTSVCRPGVLSAATPTVPSSTDNAAPVVHATARRRRAWPTRRCHAANAALSSGYGPLRRASSWRRSGSWNSLIRVHLLGTVDNAAQPAASLMEIRLHCTLTDVESGCHFGDRQFVDIEQRHRDSLLLGELGEQCGQVGVDTVLVDLGDLRLPGQPLQGLALAALAAMIIVQAIDGNPADPTHRVVVVLHPAPVQVGLHEGLLDGIGRNLAVPACQCQRTNQSPVMSAKERVNGRNDLDLFVVAHRGEGVRHGVDTP